jgi:ribosomal protein S18 acetylase RimI-like enzyme
MIARNGDAVEQRLAECSLYRADLDLAVYEDDGDGAVAAYGLFWADPHTGVGLVEPMRTEDAFQRRGLARAVLTAGLERLAAAGCERFKVSYEPGNTAARRLYLTTGFTDTSTSRTWTRARRAS